MTCVDLSISFVPIRDQTLRLSAYLFELTKDPIYQQAAQLSTDFAINHLWNGSAFYYTFDPSSCSSYGDWISISQWLVEGQFKTMCSTSHAYVTSIEAYPCGLTSHRTTL